MRFTVPGYRIDRCLGRGSQGEVWLAEHLKSGDQVALKRIVLGRPGADEVARTEAALLARLDHPSLIALREFRTCQDAVVLVLELADAGSLANLLRRRDKLTPSEVVAALSPIAAALAHAHQHGVLHGDVSPANILFTMAGHPKLVDLGVARLVAGVGAGTGMGTPAYLDPVIAAGGAAGISSDVFSLGAVALHALTGTGPWQARNAELPSAEQALTMAASGRITDLEARLAPVPPGMAEVVRRALEADPVRRGTAAEFALDLRAALPPTPVVLAGGRITAPAGRHAARHRAIDPTAAERSWPGPGESVAVASRGVPAADQHRDRPGGTTSGAAASAGFDFVPADLTRVSRPLVRASLPVEPEPESAGALRAILDRMVGGSTMRAISVIGLLAILVTGAVLGWPLMRHGGTATSPPAAGHPVTPGSASPPGSAAPSGPAVTSAADAARLLVRLDDLRAQAYAERRPDLLEQVYSMPALLAADTATLTRTVPEGCRLTGLHTDYRDPQLRGATADTVVLAVQAALPAATLSCPGRPAMRTAAVSSRVLIIELGASPGSRSAGGTTGFRIASQTAG